MDAAYEVGKKAVLITPARFLFNAGFTPKAWNEKMLADAHLTVPHYVPNSDDLFPGTDHQGRHRRHLPGLRRAKVEPIGTFTRISRSSTRSSTRCVESEHRLDRVGDHQFTLLPLHREALRRPP